MKKSWKKSWKKKLEKSWKKKLTEWNKRRKKIPMTCQTYGQNVSLSSKTKYLIILCSDWSKGHWVSRSRYWVRRWWRRFTWNVGSRGVSWVAAGEMCKNATAWWPVRYVELEKRCRETSQIKQTTLINDVIKLIDQSIERTDQSVSQSIERFSFCAHLFF